MTNNSWIKHKIKNSCAVGGCIEHFNTSTGHYCYNMILTWHDDIVIFQITEDMGPAIWPKYKISCCLNILDYRCVDFYCSEVTKFCVFAYTNYGEKCAHNWDINDLKYSKRSTSLYCHDCEQTRWVKELQNNIAPTALCKDVPLRTFSDSAISYWPYNVFFFFQKIFIQKYTSQYD